MVKNVIKEALKYIVGLGEAKTQTINCDVYSDKQLYRIDTYIPKAEPIKMHTLSSLVDYIKSKVDELSEKMIIQVVSPEEVRLFSMLDCNRERETIAIVQAQIPSFEYGRFIDHETFCINVQSKFVDDETSDKLLLLKFAGTVENGSIAEYGDDGVTQKATVRQGIASKTEAVVPNPVNLIPFRTFVEVRQPASEFIFRMREGARGGIECAIFEADGGAWKLDAMASIRLYLEEQLKDVEGFIIVS